MRYDGGGAWAISHIGSVQSFSTSTFGRTLPISTFGQSATHNAMRWDHRNAVDVGLHPDSAEGRALIAYLQSNGIPFLAFRGAILSLSNRSAHSYRWSIPTAGVKLTQHQFKGERNGIYHFSFLISHL